MPASCRGPFGPKTSPMGFRPAVAAALLGLGLLTAAGPVRAAVPSSATASPPAAARADGVGTRDFTRGDLLLLGAAIGGTTLAVFNDRWLTSEAIEVGGNPDQRRLARIFQPLGSGELMVSAALGLYAAGRWTGRPELARRAERAGIAVAAAGGVAIGVKEVFGRERPLESPDRSTRFEPFSGHDSFPSGHATIAFAGAVALDRETSARWVPWVVYPAATLVAWSRVHDLKHWTSDVVAGAAIGGWTAWETEDFLTRKAPSGPPSGEQGSSLLLVPRDGTVELVAARRF